MAFVSAVMAKVLLRYSAGVAPESNWRSRQGVRLKSKSELKKVWGPQKSLILVLILRLSLHFCPDYETILVAPPELMPSDGWI